MRRSAFLAFLAIGLTVGLRLFAADRAEAITDYVLQPSDLVRVAIFQEPDLLVEERITRENTINLPLIGTINVKGRTVQQVREMIRSLYDKDYLVNPQVSLTVVEYSERTVQVVGAVNRPGAVPFPLEQKLTIVEAIARAGGQSRIADLRKVRLSRTTDDGRTENFTVNVEDLIKGENSDQWVLSKGDVIYVPERIF